MPAPLPVPNVLPGFPSLAIAGGQTARPGGPTVPRTEAGGQMASPGGQTAPRTEVGGPTARLGGPCSTRCTTHVALRLCWSHQHCLYISSHHR
jgi:hypothetical protein